MTKNNNGRRLMLEYIDDTYIASKLTKSKFLHTPIQYFITMFHYSGDIATTEMRKYHDVYRNTMTNGVQFFTDVKCFAP